VSVETLPGPTRSCVWHDGPAPAACDPPVSACLRFDYNEGTMRGKTGAMADRASACCAYSVRLLRATVWQRRTSQEVGSSSEASSLPCAQERRWHGARRARSGTPDPALHCAGQPGFHHERPFRCTCHCTLLFQILAAHPPLGEGLASGRSL
jgi:hypothetical protein